MTSVDDVPAQRECNGEVKVVNDGVEIDFGSNPDVIEVSVFDALGRLVKNETTQGFKCHKMQLVPGFYVVSWRSQSDSGSQSAKVK